MAIRNNTFINHTHKIGRKSLPVLYTTSLAMTGSPKYPPIKYHSKLTSYTVSPLLYSY